MIAKMLIMIMIGDDSGVIVMMIAVNIITTLRARKYVPWMAGMTALEASPFLTSVNILQFCLPHVKQAKALAIREDYHVIITISISMNGIAR